MFEREQLRCKLLEARVDEMKLKKQMKLEQLEQLESEPQPPQEPLDASDPDEFLRIISSDTEFQEAFSTFQNQITKWEKKRQERQFVMEPTDFEMQSQLPYDPIDQPLEEISNDQPADELDE